MNVHIYLRNLVDTIPAIWDGRVLCNSFPIYGNGTEAGNEDGYLVGMLSCYPQPGSVKIAPMEKLTIISNYSSAQMHTGVMGYYYILVAEPLPKSNPFFHSLDVADLVFLNFWYPCWCFLWTT
nr:uncharacterized protein LOC109163135 [Ipomoea trifida]